LERNRCKVLVVENEGLIANEIESRLNQMGHQVVATASTSKEALDRAPEADIVLMERHHDVGVTLIVIRAIRPAPGRDAIARPGALKPNRDLTLIPRRLVAKAESEYPGLSLGPRVLSGRRCALR
jgi:CheY-like chemotaxis protein